MIRKGRNLVNLHRLNRNDPTFREEVRAACKTVLNARSNDEEREAILALMALLPNN